MPYESPTCVQPSVPLLHPLAACQMHASWPLVPSDGQLPLLEPPQPVPATQAWMDEAESPATHVSPSAQSAVLEQLMAI